MSPYSEWVPVMEENFLSKIDENSSSRTAENLSIVSFVVQASIVQQMVQYPLVEMTEESICWSMLVMRHHLQELEAANFTYFEKFCTIFGLYFEKFCSIFGLYLEK